MGLAIKSLHDLPGRQLRGDVLEFRVGVLLSPPWMGLKTGGMAAPWGTPSSPSLMPRGSSDRLGPWLGTR